MRKGKFVGDTLNEGSILYQSGKPLIIQFAATHAGRLTLKNAIYQPRRMFEAKDSFITPVQRPVLISHDWQSDPIGRVKEVDYISLANDFTSIDPSRADKKQTIDIINYMKDSGVLFKKDFNGLGYLRLTAKITDKDAIEKFLDERYLTFSTGASVTDHFCPLCDYSSLHDCDHRPGVEYDEGGRCFSVTDKLHYVEVSVVSVPADEAAGLESIQPSMSDTNEEDMMPVSISLSNDFLLTIEEDSLMSDETKDLVKEEPVIEEDNSPKEDVQPELFDLDTVIDQPDVIYKEIEKELDQLLADGEIEEDAKLSTKQRKALKSNVFCGPNRSVPVNDCAHYTAALRLLGRVKASEATKARIKACVERKGKSLGCNSGQDSAYNWLAKDADRIMDRLSDFDLSTLIEMVSNKAEERGLDSLPVFDDMKAKIEISDSLKQKNGHLDETITDQQNELTKLTTALKKASSYVRSFSKVLTEKDSISDIETLFTTDDEITIDQCLVDLEKIASDESIKEVINGMLDTVEEIELETDIENPVLDGDSDINNDSVYKDSVIETVKRIYCDKKVNEGSKQADMYLQRMKNLSQVPEDFIIEEDK